MTGWIIYTEADAQRNSGFIDMFIKKFAERGIALSLKIRENLTVGITDNESLPDFAMVRTIEPLLTKQLENLGVRCFNNYKVSSLCNSKAKTYMYMQKNGIPILNTYIGYYNKEQFPVVMKPNDGHGGKNVILANNRSEYEKAVKLYNGSNFVVQEVANNRGRDVRVYVVGKKIIAAMLRISDSDFRSNFCLGGKAVVYNLNEEETALVNKIISLFDFDFVGIDFVFHNNKAVFNEIEDVVGSRMLYSHTDIDIAEIVTEHIVKSLKK
jgi:RimK family alpha-L-glutamate ligase